MVLAEKVVAVYSAQFYPTAYPNKFPLLCEELVITDQRLIYLNRTLGSTERGVDAPDDVRRFLERHTTTAGKNNLAIPLKHIVEINSGGNWRDAPRLAIFYTFRREKRNCSFGVMFPAAKNRKEQYSNLANTIRVLRDAVLNRDTPSPVQGENGASRVDSEQPKTPNA
jgi:hypothetical protein